MAKRGRKSWKEMMEKGIEIDWETYGTINSPKSKYLRGDKIHDINSLLKQKVVVFGNICRNIDWVLSQQLREIIYFLEKGALYYAIPKEKKKKENE